MTLSKAVTDVKGGGVVVVGGVGLSFPVSTVGDRAPVTLQPQPPVFQISSLRAISSPLCRLAVSRSSFFSPIGLV